MTTHVHGYYLVRRLNAHPFQRKTSADTHDCSADYIANIDFLRSSYQIILYDNVITGMNFIAFNGTS